MNKLGVFHSYSDPSAALISNGKVIAFAEEERLLRIKHAQRYFPSRAVRYVLEAGSMEIHDVDCIAPSPGDCPAYDNGKMAAVYERINARTGWTVNSSYPNILWCPHHSHE